MGHHIGLQYIVSSFKTYLPVASLNLCTKTQTHPLPDKMVVEMYDKPTVAQNRHENELYF